MILAGPLGDRRGRKPVIFMSAVFYTIGSILMAANFGSLSELLVGRVVSGIGSGFGMVVGPIYISEVAPLELRGMMTTFYNVNIMAGVSGSYWINYASEEALSPNSNWQWRSTMVLQLIPSIALFVGYPFFPESPRYLMLRGQMEAAKHSLSKLRGGLDESNDYFAGELAELQSKMDANAESQGGLDALKSLAKLCVRHAPTRKMVLFVSLIQLFFIFSGGNSITYYAPTILTSIGLNSKQVLLFTAVYGCIKLVSVFIYAFALTDRFGRRPLLLIGSTINLICLIYLAAFLGTTDISASASPSPAAWVAIVAICVFAIGYGFGWAPAFSLTASEICPTNIRSTVVTIAFIFQNLLNFAITRGFPNMTLSMHSYGPFALFAAFTFCGTVWVFFAFPECKRRSMENTDELFSMPWYKIGFSKVPMDSMDVNANVLRKEQGSDGDLERQGSFSGDEKGHDEQIEVVRGR